MRNGISRTYHIELTPGIQEQQLFILPTDMEVYRLTWSASSLVIKDAFVISPEVQIIVSSQPIETFRDSFQIPYTVSDHVLAGNDRVFCFNYDTLVMDHRAQNAKMTGVFYVAFYTDLGNELITQFVHVLVEGFAK